MSFTLSNLPYAFNALEPFIDATTMEIHHDKHHQGYISNLNKAIEGTDLAQSSIEDILANVSKYSAAVRNNGGGHYNHNLFWSILCPAAQSGAPSESLNSAINATFGSLDALKEKVNAAGATRFGSGWAWVCVGSDKKLHVCSSANQDNPLMDIAECKGTPIIAIDVWEHAYYLKYQNKRPDYLSSIWSVINWTEVNKRYEDAVK